MKLNKSKLKNNTHEYHLQTKWYYLISFSVGFGRRKSTTRRSLKDKLTCKKTYSPIRFKNCLDSRHSTTPEEFSRLSEEILQVQAHIYMFYVLWNVLEREFCEEPETTEEPEIIKDRPTHCSASCQGKWSSLLTAGKNFYYTLIKWNRHQLCRWECQICLNKGFLIKFLDKFYRAEVFNLSCMRGDLYIGWKSCIRSIIFNLKTTFKVKIR